jgi:uncharacterized membrane protein YeaQ/YmgE (transglycosylase-associated protein family)
MGFIVAIFIGGIIGWLASLIMKTNAQMGLIANIVISVVGSSSDTGVPAPSASLLAAPW